MAEAINWSSLPNIPRVMNEFVRGQPDVIRLLGGSWREAEAREGVMRRRADWATPSGLATALRKGYDGLYVSPELEKNLSLLEKQETLAIVTGQQIGLFGGPLYTFYKALHVILLAERLSAEVARPVVPVFWMETADADFGEVNRIAFPPLFEGPRRAIYTPVDIVTGKSISCHQLSAEIIPTLEEVVEWMAGLPNGVKLAACLRESYRPGRMMSEAFRRLLNEVFGVRGLVMVDARDEAVASLTRDFWTKALSRPESLNGAFRISSDDLEKLRLPLQVKLRDDALPVLYVDEGGSRKRLVRNGGGWSIGPGTKPLTDSELLALAEDRFASLTPSALLRPLFQDWLLPTWIYVGGPAEVSYHAQVGRCYDILEIPRPLISPRMSVTLVERSARRRLEKQSWTVSDVIGGREILLSKSGKAEALSDLFNSGAEHIQSWIRRIEKAADENGINIYGDLELVEKKMEHQWQKLRGTALHKLSELDRARVGHAEKLLDTFLPDGVLQERHSSWLYFLAQKGDEVIKRIEEEVDLFNPRHLAIDLGGE